MKLAMRQRRIFSGGREQACAVRWRRSAMSARSMLFEEKMVEGMVRRGYEREFATRCFEQIKGFGSYGFPESHAAAFAQLVYVSSWIKKYHPAAFAAALLELAADGVLRARADHPGCAGAWRGDQACRCELQPLRQHAGDARRRRASRCVLGFRQLDGVKEEEAIALVEPARGWLCQRIRHARAGRRFFADAAQAGGCGCVPELVAAGSQGGRCGRCGVCRMMMQLPLFAAAAAKELGEEPEPDLPEMPFGEHVVADYQTARLSLKSHPMQVLRPVFAGRRRSQLCGDDARCGMERGADGGDCAGATEAGRGDGDLHHAGG